MLPSGSGLRAAGEGSSRRATLGCARSQGRHVSNMTVLDSISWLQLRSVRGRVTETGQQFAGRSSPRSAPATRVARRPDAGYWPSAESGQSATCRQTAEPGREGGHREFRTRVPRQGAARPSARDSRPIPRAATGAPVTAAGVRASLTRSGSGNASCWGVSTSWDARQKNRLGACGQPSIDKWWRT